jgi:hypothetical protein
MFYYLSTPGEPLLFLDLLRFNIILKYILRKFLKSSKIYCYTQFRTYAK